MADFNLDSNSHDKLVEAISDVFDHDTLERVVWTATHEGLFKKYAGPRLPLEATVQQMLFYMAEHEPDVLPLVFAHMLRAKPDAPDLRKVIEGACSVVNEIKLEMQDQVTTLIAGLQGFLDYIGDPANNSKQLIDTIRNSRTIFSQAHSSIDQLELYKILHDNLHDIHLRSHSDRMAIAEQFDTSGIHKSSLREDIYRIGGVIKELDVMTSVHDFDKMPLKREARWIDKLRKIHAELKDAQYPPQGAVAPQSAIAKKAYGKLRQLLLSELTRIDQEIAFIAESLPIAALDVALSDMAKNIATGDTPANIAGMQSVGRSLNTLQTTILGRVKQHNAWQETDEEVQSLEIFFEDEPKTAWDNFQVMWFDVKNKIEENLGPEIHDTSAGDLKTGIVLVEDTMAMIDRVLGDEDPTNDMLEDQIARLGDVFAECNLNVRFWFKEIDSKLRTDCSHLVKVGTSIQQMLTVANV